MNIQPVSNSGSPVSLNQSPPSGSLAGRSVTADTPNVFYAPMEAAIQRADPVSPGGKRGFTGVSDSSPWSTRAASGLLGS